MKALSRANHILNSLAKFGQVQVTELASELEVSVETIRRDLKVLDESGDLVRIHGGAINKEYQDVGTSFNNRASHNLQEKRTLVEGVLEHLYEGAVIGLDASSSSWLVAESIPNMHCTVVTNSLNNIGALTGKDNINVICLGGIYSNKYKSFYGIISNNTLGDMTLDVSVMSCVGFDKESGVWDSNEFNYEIKKMLVKSSRKNILVADKSKYGKRSLMKICDFSEVDVLVTNCDCF